MKTLKTKLILLLLLSQILACGTEKEDPSVIFIIKEQLPKPKPKNEKVLLKYSSVHEIVNLQNLSSTSIQPSLDKKGKKGPTELKIPEGNYRLKISHYAEYQYPNFSENKETIKKQKVILSSKYSFPFRVLNGTPTVAISTSDFNDLKQVSSYEDCKNLKACEVVEDSDEDGLHNHIELGSLLLENQSNFLDPLLADTDGDGICDGLGKNLEKKSCGSGGSAAIEKFSDASPNFPQPKNGDSDGDGVLDALDNCPSVKNPFQKDSDKDQLGNLCDPDIDGDGICNEEIPEWYCKRELGKSFRGINDPDEDDDGVLNESDCDRFDKTGQVKLETFDLRGRICVENDDDIDNDGKINSRDDFPYDFCASQDNNSDGLADFLLDNCFTKRGQGAIRILDSKKYAIWSVASSIDGKVFASANGDHTVKLWNPQNGKLLATLNGHTDQVNSVAFNPDGKSLASGSWDSSVKIWDLSSNKETLTIKGGLLNVNTLSYDQNGKSLAIGFKTGKIKIFDPSDGKELMDLKGHDKEVLALAYDRKNKYLLSSAEDNKLKIWDLSSKSEHKNMDLKAKVKAIAFSWKGETLAINAGDEIRLYNTDSWELIRNFKGHNSHISSLVFSKDGSFLYSGGADRNIKVWDLRGQKLLKWMQGHGGDVNSLAISSDGKTLVSGSFDKSLRVWDISRKNQIRSFSGHNNVVNSIIFKADNNWMASSGDDNSIRFWDLSKEIFVFKDSYGGETSTNIAFHPKEKDIAGYIAGNFVILINLRDGKLKSLTHLAMAKSISFHPEGKLMASGDDAGNLFLWNSDTKSKDYGKSIKTFVAHDKRISGLSFSSDGKYLASSSEDKLIKIWDASSGELKKTIKEHKNSVNSILFSPDAKSLVSTSCGEHKYYCRSGALKLWDPETGKLIREFIGHIDEVWSAAFSPDGKVLASVSSDQSLKTWDPKTGKLIHSFIGHNGPVRGVNFSPDGRFIATSSSDQSIRLWSRGSTINPGQEVPEK